MESQPSDLRSPPPWSFSWYEPWSKQAESMSCKYGGI